MKQRATDEFWDDLGNDELDEIALRYDNELAAKDKKTGADNNKTIRIVKGEIARMVDEAESALLAVADSAPIMVRAGMLVQPIIDKLPASHGRMTEVALLRPLT